MFTEEQLQAMTKEEVIKLYLQQQQESVRQMLVDALARALWETKLYHRSMLTRRCGPVL